MGRLVQPSIIPWDPAIPIANVHEFGEHGGVNPSIAASVIYTFLHPDDMGRAFKGELPEHQDECYLYGRYENPTVVYLGRLVAAMEDMEACLPTASGMSAIYCATKLLLSAGDAIISSRMIYGGTHALFKNILPRDGIKVKFVNPDDHDSLRELAAAEKPKVIFVETEANPRLTVANLPVWAEIARQVGAKLVVDNTFTPLSITPRHYGADIVVYSLTKFVAGQSRHIAGAICCSKEMAKELIDLQRGPIMLFGPTMDALVAANIAFQVHSLPLRIKAHSERAQFLANKLLDNFKEVEVIYPGLGCHQDHQLFQGMMNKGYGFGGMMAIDVGSKETAYELMSNLQMKQRFAYLAVSLGHFRSLMSCSASSTSSEISVAEQNEMGLSQGLIRFSIGFIGNERDQWKRLEAGLRAVGLS